jgi:ABC-type sugar transport system substrate-binding protein
MSMKEGAELEAAKWNARVLTLAPERETDVEAEFQIIENFIEQEVDAIVLAPCGAKEILPALAKVNKANIPIVIVDSDIDRPAAAKMGVTTSTYVGSDNEEGGRLAALFMMEKLAAAGATGGEIAIVQATPGHESTDARQRGFERELAKHADAPVIVARQPANGERARAYTVAQNILQAHPNLRGIFALNDEMSVAVVEAVDAAGKLPSTIIVGLRRRAGGPGQHSAESTAGDP